MTGLRSNSKRGTKLGTSAVWVVIVLWSGIYFARGLLLPPTDGDLWWQHWLGDLIFRTHHLPSSLGPETFTSAGAPWVPQEWAFSVLVAAAMDHRVFWLLALLVSAVPGVILWSIYLRSRTKASPDAIAIVLLFCGVALSESFGIRDQVVAWACFAMFWWALERRDPWFYATVPIVAIWANFHASVMIAPAIVFARLVGLVLDGGVGALWISRELRVFPLILVALVCTPLGWHLPVYAIRVETSLPILHRVSEEQPVRIRDLAFFLGSLPIALLLLLPNPRNLLRYKAESLPLLMLFVAMIFQVRQAPLFAIAAAPLAARHLDLAVPRLAEQDKRARKWEPVTLIAISLMILFAAVFLVQTLRGHPQAQPTAAMSSLAGDGRRHRVFCQDFAWCSVALQFPNLRVFTDGRLDPFPARVWDDYLSVFSMKPSWEQTLDQYNVDSVVALRGSPFERKLAADTRWRDTFTDERYKVYERRKRSQE